MMLPNAKYDINLLNNEQKESHLLTIILLLSSRENAPSDIVEFQVTGT